MITVTAATVWVLMRMVCFDDQPTVCGIVVMGEFPSEQLCLEAANYEDVCLPIKKENA
jgi:hypothetical protein